MFELGMCEPVTGVYNIPDLKTAYEHAQRICAGRRDRCGEVVIAAGGGFFVRTYQVHPAIWEMMNAA